MKVIHVVFECIPGNSGVDRNGWYIMAARSGCRWSRCGDLGAKPEPGFLETRRRRVCDRVLPEHSLLGTHWSQAARRGAGAAGRKCDVVTLTTPSSC